MKFLTHNTLFITHRIIVLTIFAGNYFSTHFIMGGEKFDTPQPEAYLFGENMDLNFFSKCPTSVSKLQFFKGYPMHFYKHFHRFMF